MLSPANKIFPLKLDARESVPICFLVEQYSKSKTYFVIDHEESSTIIKGVPHKYSVLLNESQLTICHRGKLEHRMEWYFHVRQFFCALVHEISQDTSHHSLLNNTMPLYKLMYTFNIVCVNSIIIMHGVNF